MPFADDSTEADAEPPDLNQTHPLHEALHVSRPRASSSPLTATPSSWLTPKARGVSDPSTGGRGVVALSTITAGETLAIFGGSVSTFADLLSMPRGRRRRALQISDEHFIVSTVDGPADWINHSCEPNAGFRSAIELVAMRRIAPDEHICFDYAMSDSLPYDEFDCACGSPACRERVSCRDWSRVELWDQFGRFFSPYLQVRMLSVLRSHNAVHDGPGLRAQSSATR